MAIGRRPPQLKEQRANQGTKIQTGGKGNSETVEDKINELAKALGMPSKDLASAIAGAVAQYVPPATLSSVAAHETGPAVEALIKGASEGGKEEEKAKQQADENGDAGVLGGVVSGMGTFVGMDEP